MNIGRFYHFSGRAAACLAFLLLGAMAVGASAKEAADETIVAPPPRSIEDIARLLEYYKPDATIAAKARAETEAAPPLTNDRKALFEFYWQRAQAAGQIGRVRQQIDDLRKAREFGEPGTPGYILVVRNLAMAEGAGGNMLTAVRVAEEGLKNVPQNGRGHELNLHQQAVGYYTALGDFAKAEEHLRGVEGLFVVLKRSNSWGDKGNGWTANFERARGKLFSAEGRFVEAEGALRKALHAQELNLRDNEKRLERGEDTNPQDSVLRGRDAIERDLAVALMGQGKLVEAEIYARQAIRHALERAGRASTDVAQGLGTLARIVGEEGRNAEAVRLAEAALECHRLAGAVPDSLPIAAARRALGSALVDQRRYVDAVRVFEDMREGLRTDPELLEKVGSGDLDWVLALLRTGREQAAEHMASAMLEKAAKRFGEKDARTAEVRAFHAMALALRGEQDLAHKEFTAAIPILVDQVRNDAEAESGSIKRQQRLAVIIESYIRLLSRMQQARPGESGLDYAAESFRLADIARGSAVQRALTASAARANIADPQLADLARREQDAQRRVNALSDLLRQLLSAPPDQQLPKIQTDIRADIEGLKAERGKLKREIERRYPDYAELVDPKPATLSQARGLLHVGEALVTWYFGEDEGYVWAVSDKGEAVFASVPISRAQLAREVGDLRKALDPGVADIQDVPPFDVAKAHRLYQQLLQPTREVWGSARVVIAVPHAELGQLPLALLPTESVVLPARSSVPFENYKRVPWLVRSVAVAQVPSVTALASLRRMPPPSTERRNFIGFGDPIFSSDQAKEAGIKLAASGAVSTRGARLSLRNTPKMSGVDSAELSLLPRLPDTGEEIREIGQVLHAEPEQDIFLQLRATEAAVTAADLSRRVVMFATHGLVPGELNGLTQPALALTSPQLTGGSGDGLLTMDNILGLRLNADWVVLSACNTAAGDGAGSEAVSGLGRAFFYAGARALLVSNWPVETVSARLLMTDLFRRQSAEGRQNKAEALRQAMLALLDGPGSVDPATRRVNYAYAHPLFWAPFVVVGD